MNKNISNHLQDADVLFGTGEKYQPTLTEFGLPADFIANGRAIADSLRARATAYDNSINEGKDKTTVQNAQLSEAVVQIDTVRKYARIVYYGDKNMLKQFHVGVKLVKKVAFIASELSYIRELGEQHKTDLLAAGLKETDLTILETSLANLREADTAQENALKAQGVLCTERDKLLDDLLTYKFKLRQIAAVAFRGNKAVLAEFKSIVPSSYKKKSDDSSDTSTETTTEPTT